MKLIERVWFHQHPSKWLLVPLLLPLMLIFAVLSGFRRLLYRLGILSSFEPSLPVIVVGNIGIGGNGKTPLTIYLIELCQQLGISVGVVSRGYGGTPPTTPYLVTDNSTPIQAGDEPTMIYQRCQIPVAVGANRLASIDLLKQQGCQLILADDGLQHYKLRRSKELIVVDGKRLFGNGLLLPAGPLREGKWRLSTADLVIVNGGSQQITANQLNMTLAPQTFINLKTGEQCSVEDFASQYPKVNAVAAIGDPARFFNTLKQCSIDCEIALDFADHHQFSAQDFQQFTSEVPLLMTEKDAIKCQGFAQGHWWYLAVNAEFDQQSTDALKKLLMQVIEHSNN
ncbi:tetraacyldisaccharide 4'-kinase [Colwellia sp. MEBiC06753]